MPYRNRYNRRAKPRLNRYRKRRYVLSRSPLAKSEAAVANDVHYFDNALTDTSVREYSSGTKFVYRFMQIAQGTDQQNRLGKKINLRSIALNMSMYRNSASTSHDRLRIVLVKVKNTDAIPVINDMYLDMYDTTLSTVSTSLQAYRAIRDGQLTNFKVVKEWNVDLGYLATDKSTKILKYYHKFKKPVPVWYNSSSGVPPTINEYILLAVSDTTANWPLLAVTSRVTYNV